MQNYIQRDGCHNCKCVAVSYSLFCNKDGVAKSDEYTGGYDPKYEVEPHGICDNHAEDRKNQISIV